jgi:hypothetical protein
LELADPQTCLIHIENFTDSELVVERVAIEQDGVALTKPLRATPEVHWTVPPRLQRPISWRPEPNPADSLVRLHSNEGIQFNTTIEFVLAIRAMGVLHEHRQKMAVKVLAANGRLKPLAG